MLDLIIEYLSALGLAGLLVGVLIESMGIPFPGGIMIILTGFLVNQGRLEFTNALAVILSGYTAGSIIAYYIGKNIGQPFLMRCGNYFHVPSDKFEQAQVWLDRSAPAFIVFGRFVPGISNLTPYMAGVSRISVAHFLLYNSVFALGWGSLYLLLGMFFGYNYYIITDYLNTRLPLAILGLVGAYFIYKYVRRFCKKCIKNI